MDSRTEVLAGALERYRHTTHIHGITLDDAMTLSVALGVEAPRIKRYNGGSTTDFIAITVPLGQGQEVTLFIADPVIETPFGPALDEGQVLTHEQEAERYSIRTDEEAVA